MRPYNRYTSRFDTTDAQIVRPYKSLHVSMFYSYTRNTSATRSTSNTRITRRINDYDTAIGVALTGGLPRLLYYLYATSAFLSLKLLDPAETVGGLYVEQYDICLGHLNIYVRLTIGRSTL